MSLVFYSRTLLSQPPWMEPTEGHFGRKVSPALACVFVAPRRPPGGVLLRRKRLIKKHRKWVKAEAARLERACLKAAQSVKGVFEKRCSEPSFMRSLLIKEVAHARDA